MHNITLRSLTGATYGWGTRDVVINQASPSLTVTLYRS